jgi:hypothetical protein
MAEESSKTGKNDVDVEELLKKLQLSDAERAGVVLAKEDRESLPAVRNRMPVSLRGGGGELGNLKT